LPAGGGDIDNPELGSPILAEPEIDMELADTVATDNVGERHIVIEHVIGEHGEGVFHAIGAPECEKLFSNFNRGLGHSLSP
jgi:hypothetical protein